MGSGIALWTCERAGCHAATRRELYNTRARIHWGAGAQDPSPDTGTGPLVPDDPTAVGNDNGRMQIVNFLLGSNTHSYTDYVNRVVWKKY